MKSMKAYTVCSFKSSLIQSKACCEYGLKHENNMEETWDIISEDLFCLPIECVLVLEHGRNFIKAL